MYIHSFNQTSLKGLVFPLRDEWTEVVDHAMLADDNELNIGHELKDFGFHIIHWVTLYISFCEREPFSLNF